VRLIPVTRARGLELARNIPITRPGGVPLLRAGATISERYQRHLIEKGIHAVWVHDPLSEGIEPAELLPEPVRQQTADQVHRALDDARRAFATNQPLAPRAMQELAQVAELIARNLVDTPDAALALNDLAEADAYTHRHSVNVAALGLLLARETFRRHGWTDYRGKRRFDRVEERLGQIGLGLLLHDIGKMAVPRDVLNKPGKLDQDEWEVMKSHPDMGVAMLNPRVMSPLVMSVVRSHHERMDGSGYPRGLVGERISQFARIAAVADVYDAITSSRPYREAQPAAVGVKAVLDGEGRTFDAQVVGVFRRCVFPHPVGTEVELDDGRHAVVCANDPETPFEPTVRVATDDGPLEFRFTPGVPTGSA
jgi:HD-GYP domain-containing protein (c-di-GMP phosphodiesterase class II)